MLSHVGVYINGVHIHLLCSTVQPLIPLFHGPTRQIVVCHHAYVYLSRLMDISQSRPHYISENQKSACQTKM